MDVFFPVQFGFGENAEDGICGPPVDDAGTIYVCRDYEVDEDWLGASSDDDVLVAKTTIKEIVEDCLNGWRTKEGYTDDAYVRNSDALAAALRAAADMLDAAKRPID